MEKPHNQKILFKRGWVGHPHPCLPYICPFEKVKDTFNIIIAVLCSPVWPTVVFMTNLVSSKWPALQNFRVELFYARPKQVDW